MKSLWTFTLGLTLGIAATSLLPKINEKNARMSMFIDQEVKKVKGLLEDVSMMIGELKNGSLKRTMARKYRTLKRTLESLDYEFLKDEAKEVVDNIKERVELLVEEIKEQVVAMDNE